MVIIISISFIFIIIIKTCHDDGLAKVFQHEGQGGACVGEGVRPVQDNKPDCDDYVIIYGRPAQFAELPRS